MPAHPEAQEASLRDDLLRPEAFASDDGLMPFPAISQAEAASLRVARNPPKRVEIRETADHPSIGPNDGE